MRITKSDHSRYLGLWSGYIFVLSFVLNFHLSAQMKFTVQLSSGTYQQYSLEGLKLTFNNNSSFSIWQNGEGQNVNFTSVDKVTFSNQPLNISDNIISPDISAYIDKSSCLLHIQGGNREQADIQIFSIQGKVLFIRKQLVSEPIDVSRLPTGIYILSIGNQFIKFMKP